MPYQEAWWAEDTSLAVVECGPHGRAGEHRGFPWKVGRWGNGFARSWKALRMLFHHRNCWLLFLKGLQGVMHAA